MNKYDLAMGGRRPIELKPVDYIPISGLITGGERNSHKDLLFTGAYNLVTSMAFVAYHILSLPVLYKGLELLTNK